MKSDAGYGSFTYTAPDDGVGIWTSEGANSPKINGSPVAGGGNDSSNEGQTFQPLRMGDILNASSDVTYGVNSKFYPYLGINDKYNLIIKY